MAKAVKYPKKFRQKLEKVKEAREEREAKEADALEDATHPDFRTFWRSFLPRRSVHALYTRLDEVNRRLVSEVQMRERTVSRLRVSAPWDGREPAPSE
jgi:hypothetical protein